MDRIVYEFGEAWLAVATYAGVSSTCAFGCTYSGFAVAVSVIMKDLRGALPPDIIIFGGESRDENGRCCTLDTVERWNAMYHRWEAMPHMHFKRWGAAVGVLSNRITVCGGAHFSEDFADFVCPITSLRSAECFECCNCSWSQLSPMLCVRVGAVASMLDGYLYVCGGGHGGDEIQAALMDDDIQSSVERLNATTGSWEAQSDMLQKRSHAAAARLGNRIVVCGGSQGLHDLSSVEAFCLSSGWQALPPLSQPRSFASAVAAGNSIYVCGGRCSMGDCSLLERFCFEIGTWEVLAKMPARVFDGGAIAASGKILYFGGCSPNNNVTTQSFSYDISKGMWFDWESMPEGRYGFVAVEVFS